MKSSSSYGRNQPLVDAIEAALTAWREAVRAEVESNYSDAMLSIERANAEGFYTGLRVAYITLNGHEPELAEDLCLSCEGLGFDVRNEECGNCEGRGTLE
jgi:hypothetical protein